MNLNMEELVDDFVTFYVAGMFELHVLLFILSETVVLSVSQSVCLYVCIYLCMCVYVCVYVYMLACIYYVCLYVRM